MYGLPSVRFLLGPNNAFTTPRFRFRFLRRRQMRLAQPHRTLVTIFVVVLGSGASIGALGACKGSSRATQEQQRSPAVSGQAASAPGASSIPGYSDDGQWPMAAKDYANSRYSSLNEITPQNAKNLRVVSTFSTGVLRGHEAAPLVVNNTMYIVTPWPNILYAIDLTQPGGATTWTYKPKPEPSAQGVACCDVVNRGAAYYEGRIYYNTLDNHTVAVDANSGEEVWNTKIGDINMGQTMTMAPLVVKGKVLVGNSGGGMGIRGWVTALD